MRNYVFDSVTHSIPSRLVDRFVFVLFLSGVLIDRDDLAEIALAPRNQQRKRWLNSSVGARSS
ncbi:hypothetical protein HZZ13_14450 [Bradyrhizobium sp. CNPSo 4010]|uniref:Uncharacterized protein n=1 Tax=Bradyrhizobium agreste TaxID=2751811 RepID=A0ABS0PP47_9BRAD|nr:hypothetical protein [Bradyrhizobium agreste]MBH5398976.1 hypothetical protein [Bradyrhizobium agreste]